MCPRGGVWAKRGRAVQSMRTAAASYASAAMPRCCRCWLCCPLPQLGCNRTAQRRTGDSCGTHGNSSFEKHAPTGSAARSPASSVARCRDALLVHHSISRIPSCRRCRSRRRRPHRPRCGVATRHAPFKGELRVPFRRVRRRSFGCGPQRGCAPWFRFGSDVVRRGLRRRTCPKPRFF